MLSTIFSKTRNSAQARLNGRLTNQNQLATSALPRDYAEDCSSFASIG